MPSRNERRNTKQSSSAGQTNGNNHKKTPVTVMVPDVLDKNVAAHCAITRSSKSKFITDALEKALDRVGLDPYREPTISY